MNATDWLGALDPVPMLDYLDGKSSDRKFRLFACASARRCWSLFRYPIPRQSIELAERLAEGTATAEEVEEMRQQAEISVGNAPMYERAAYQAAAATLVEVASEAARGACEFVRQQAVNEAAESAPMPQMEAAIIAEESARENRALGRLILEVYGNPFRPVRIESAWLHSLDDAVRKLAEWIDEGQRWEELPYLADALLDAGCTEDDLLRHLRDPGPHLRGCWALDAILGRS
jgi:hypothetical protein